jgi:hypothetical protein
MSAPKRGQCRTCRYRWRLRKDGTLQAHHLYSGSERQPECEGSRKPPRPFDPNECPECLMHIGRQPFLAEACASVGIERGKSTEAMLRDYLVQFHERKHEEAA